MGNKLQGKFYICLALLFVFIITFMTIIIGLGLQRRNAVAMLPSIATFSPNHRDMRRGVSW